MESLDQNARDPVLSYYFSINVILLWGGRSYDLCLTDKRWCKETAEDFPNVSHKQNPHKKMAEEDRLKDSLYVARSTMAQPIQLYKWIM